MFLLYRSFSQAPYPSIVQAINTQLEALRKVGTCIQRPLVSAIIRAHILHGAPHLYDEGFKQSDTWVANYILDQLGWVERKSTQKAHKLPRESLDLCVTMHARITITTRVHNIHPDCIVNADQTGLSLFPTGKYTYEKKGSKDVMIAGHDEKRQVRAFITKNNNFTFYFIQTTVVVASSMSGNILPFQSIWDYWMLPTVTFFLQLTLIRCV